ncbi:prolipoprotein diacylglyceryl transferase [Salisediminibacterium selenitireducens]|uniref:Phosphatidylglycerol--prolipoprotein diacylglyceryl transferase n=1 Tax=Bacillus selenitireducens (strain ATCC 700615 / DSM 15326 / MLS10) TaxID=439292 RepID=D6Y105_BACIE|nr:prolipoprotein diacylglyceryl transferase [Salisediminibacterium selenitireducens]ADH98609.1 prolipoprotein diacylglyceryl transferase [[Bacillus] selenitireducens MLS10]
MFYTIQPLDPVFLELGPITIQWYGLLIGLGALIGYFIANSEAKKRGYPDDLIADLLLWMLPMGIIGARIYYVIFRWEQFADNPVSVLFIWEGGIAIHGGLIAGTITGLVFAKKKGYSFWRLADVVAPSVLLAQAIGRWGNFMNQEVYGHEVSRQFLENMMLPEFIINQMYINGAYYQPTFLYESIWNLLGVALLLYLRQVNLRQGEIFMAFAIWYSVGRFVIEYMRTDQLLFFGIPTAMLLSAALVIGALAIAIYRRKNGLADDRYLDDSDTRTKNLKKKNKTKKK